MDEIDRRILEGLLANARKKNTELARKLNIPPTTLQERIRRLEERGVVTGYRAVLDPEKMGYGVQAFIAVSLDRHEPDSIRAFEQRVNEMSRVKACYHLSGRLDYLLHVMAGDLDELGTLVKTGITALPGFGRSETFLVFSEVKPDGGWPLPDDEEG